jgi:hypothetical protein
MGLMSANFSGFCALFLLGFGSHLDSEPLNIFNCHLREWLEAMLLSSCKLGESADTNNQGSFANFVPVVFAEHF